MRVVIGPQIFPEALVTVCSYTISSRSDVPPEERLDGLHLPTSIENMPYLCALIVEVECEDHEDLFRSTDQGAPCKKYSRKSNETTIDFFIQFVDILRSIQFLPTSGFTAILVLSMYIR